MTGKDLAKFRKDAHLSQDEFAKRIGIHRTSLIRIEGSGDPVSKSILHRLDLAFKSNYSDSPDRSKYLINYYDIDATATPMEVFTDQTIVPSAKRGPVPRCPLS